MKTKLFSLIIALFFISCEKQEDEKEDCKTCTLDVNYTSNVGGQQVYVAETREICDDSWVGLHNTQDPNSGSGTNGTVHWTRTMIWHCK